MAGNNRKYSFLHLDPEHKGEEPSLFLYFLNADKIDTTDIVVIAVSPDFHQSILEGIASGEIPTLALEDTAYGMAEQLTAINKGRKSPGLATEPNPEAYILLGCTAISAAQLVKDSIPTKSTPHLAFGMFRRGQGYNMINLTAGDSSQPIDGPSIRQAFRLMPKKNAGTVHMGPRGVN